MCMQVLSIVVVIEIRISGVKVEAGFDTGYESDSLVCWGIIVVCVFGIW